MKSALLIVIATVLFSAAAYANDSPSARFIPPPGAFVNDHEIRIKSPDDAIAKRAEIIRYIWGKQGMPKKLLPTSVERGAIKVDNLKNLERIDTLHITMDAGVKGLAHLFLPKRNNNSRLVILHLGHTDGCTFNDNQPGEPDIGMRRSLNAFLSAGFSVLGVYMPQVTPEDCRWEHDKLFKVKTTGNPLKFFLEPTLAGINYIMKNYPQISDISMTGLSGGGWTTTLYAAIDPRIKLSIPVAGSLPLYLCHEGYGHDIEQRLDSFYKIAGYPDLYVLGSYGVGRKQIQVLNRRDDCCFGENQHDRRLTNMLFEPSVREYEARVIKTLERLGTGSFRLFIDEKADRHKLSAHALEKVLLPELKASGTQKQ